MPLLKERSDDTAKIADGPKKVSLGVRIRRGRVVAFYPATWTADVQLDGSIGLVTMPVGDWVNPATIPVNAKVAALLFNDLDPNDGLIIGAYGGLGGWDYFQRDTVPAGGSLTIPAGHTMTVKGPLSIVGSLNIIGRLFIE